MKGLRASVAVACIVGGGAPLGCQALEGDAVRGKQPLWFTRPSGALHVNARRTLTAAGRTVGEDYERGRAEIDENHGRVFVGSADHGLYALRASSLSTLWRFETLGVVQSEPYYDNDLDYLYFGSHDGALYCVRAFDGSLVWRFATGAEVTRRPARDGETIFIANGADNLFAIDRRTGKLAWNQHRTPALGMEIAGHAGPTYEDGVVFVAYSDGSVHAYYTRPGAANGQPVKAGDEKWSIDLAAEAEHAINGEQQRYLDVDTTPILDTVGGARVLYVASYAGGVFARDAETGQPVWKNDRAVGVTDLALWVEPAHAPNPDGPNRGTGTVPGRKYLLASSATSGLWALETGAGRQAWRVPIPEGGVTAPVSVAGALMVGTTRYGLFLLSPLNGKVIDGFDLGTGFSQTPTAFGNRAYTLSNAGTLLSIQVEPPVVRTQAEAAADARRAARELQERQR